MFERSITPNELIILLESNADMTFKFIRCEKGYKLQCSTKGINYKLFGAAHKPKEKIFVRLQAGVDFMEKLRIHSFTVDIGDLY
jgi:hypothetical protein